MFHFEYSITRSFTFRYFTQAVLFLGLLWLVFITILNIVAVAYEIVPITTTAFNDSVSLWYENSCPPFGYRKVEIVMARLFR
jgi:hypothetical protein